MSTPRLEIIAIEGIGEVREGDALNKIISLALSNNQLQLMDGDLVTVCQKIVSKSEGCTVGLKSIIPSEKAKKIAAQCQRDPRIVELILRESTELVRVSTQAIIARHRLGFVVANAAIDQSNVAGGRDMALLLPQNPDASAQRLRSALEEAHDVQLSVIITDSFGRPFRNGVTGVAIGAAGLQSLQNLRGQPDRNGDALQGTEVALADQLAAAATLLMGEADEGRPVVIIRGMQQHWRQPESPAAALIRDREMDLFR